MLGGAGDELAVEALADEESKAVIAEGPNACQKAAVPEGVHGGSGDVEADGGSGFADVLVTESGSETQGDDTRNPRNNRDSATTFTCACPYSLAGAGSTLPPR